MTELAKEKEAQKEKTEPPKKWNVIMVNDDFTPFDFVEHLLMAVFSKTQEESQVIAMAVHTEGKAVIATYTKEIAETKIALAKQLAIQAQYPLALIAQEG